jgi:hypothetical protein
MDLDGSRYCLRAWVDCDWSESSSLYSDIHPDHTSNASDIDSSSPELKNCLGLVIDRGRHGKVSEARGRLNCSNRCGATPIWGAGTYRHQQLWTGKASELESRLLLLTDLCSVESGAETKDRKHVTNGNV